MATLVSPGVSISVIDQSINVGASPGTVPLIFIATQQDKPDPSGTGIAPGTTKANAGKVYSITSQRDLVTTFGDPIFYSVSGSSLNGYPLNEYGLLSAYSFLGISNLTRIVRADIDLTQLEATPLEPSSPADVNTYWFDESTAGSAYGLFIRSGTFPAEVWTTVTPKFVYDFATGSANSPVTTDGSIGDCAVVFQTQTGIVSYWKKTAAAVWTQLSGSSGTTSVVVQAVWPDLTNVLTTQQYWIKTTSPAQGANLVLRRMDASTGAFVQVETPILASDAAADTYYSTDALKSTGQIYAMITANSFEFRKCTGMVGSVGTWFPLSIIVGSQSVPRNGPVTGQLWYNALLGTNSQGESTVDIMIADGVGAWQNVNLPGFPGLVVPTGSVTVYPQSDDPRDNLPTPTLVTGDIWVQTASTTYPTISRWNGAAWILVDNTNQTSPMGIIFTDARSNPMYHSGAYTGENNSGGVNPDLDADAPQAALYPKGFLLWNTRYSTNNVKEWQSPYVFETVTASPDNTNNGSVGRWVTISGNNPGGAPYMGATAQQISIVRKIQEIITTSDDIRSEDLYYNLIAAPGFVEAIDEMLVLNDDRKNTAFVVGDTPFSLNPQATSLQAWATNSNHAYGNGEDGLVSTSKYFSAYYPSGLSTNVDGTDVVVPSSHMALRTIAYNDQVAYPWFAPAGLQRGVVNNAVGVGYVNNSSQFIPVKLSEGQRDVLYTNGINPIRTMPTGGIVIFGQKTRQSYSSATDRINVVRLENYLRYQLNILVQPFLFEPNDTTTRNAVKDAVDRFLSELITLRALYDFLTVCDLTNNTPARIDRNELWIDIAIQPVKAIEFIYIPIRIKNTGSSLAAA